jgi:nucleoside-diphosphate-sugar epimerase
MATGRVTVFGGSGFLGRQIVRRLADNGADVRVAVRHPERAAFLTEADTGCRPVRARCTQADRFQPTNSGGWRSARRRAATLMPSHWTGAVAEDEACARLSAFRSNSQSDKLKQCFGELRAKGSMS